jgi:putative DNA primase/helicase
VVAAAETRYGYAGRAFLEKLTRDKRDSLYDAFKAMSEFTVGGADGRVKQTASLGLMLSGSSPIGSSCSAAWRSLTSST